MNNKGQTAVLVVIMLLLVAVGGTFIYTSFAGGGTSQSVIQKTIQQTAEETKSGTVSSIGVYVRSVSKDDVNTKIAVPVYCQEVGSGKFIIDGTTSSTSAEITGKSTIGETVRCWAFNSTVQTLEPAEVKITGEAEHIVIDAYNLGTGAEFTFYDDTLTNANNGAVNLSVGADGSESFAKLKFKNNNTNENIPLGGFFFDVNENTNISDIDMSGSVDLKGMDHSNSLIVVSDLTTRVSSRKSQWDYVFELDDDSSKEGNQALILEENDYLETGPITISSSVGCTSGSVAGTKAQVRAFMKGYYRTTKSNTVGYGHETDASSASRIAVDITGPSIYCG